MTQYLMSVWHDPEIPVYESDEQMQQSFAATGAFNEKLKAAGKFVFANGLTAPDQAVCVDNSKGQNLVTDGPFIESKEHLGGFWVIEAADLDEALELARQASAACIGKVEVRPFQGG
jgi:hypothetical protein